MFAAVALGSEPSGMDQGQRAKWVSNASFATLTLIYTFTQILDLGTQVSTLAGVTLRVGRLLQVLSLKIERKIKPRMTRRNIKSLTNLAGVTLRVGRLLQVTAQASCIT